MAPSTLNQLAAAAATAAFFIALGHPVRAQRQLQVGVGTHLGKLEPIQKAVDALDTSFRDSVFWNEVETTRGQFEYPVRYYVNLDALVTDADARKQPTMMLLP